MTLEPHMSEELLGLIEALLVADNEYAQAEAIEAMRMWYRIHVAGIHD